MYSGEREREREGERKRKKDVLCIPRKREERGRVRRVRCEELCNDCKKLCFIGFNLAHVCKPDHNSNVTIAR